MFKFIILFLVMLNLSLYSYHKGHEDGYFLGAREMFFGKTDIIKICKKDPNCTKHIKKDIK